MTTHMMPDESDTQRKSFSLYIIGFIFSLILTAVAFGLVEYRIMSDTARYISIALLAILQCYVQAVCFLNLNFNQQGRWYSLSFLFSLLIISILAGGTLWIMYNLNYNMVH